MRPFPLWILAVAITAATCVYHWTRGPFAPVRGVKDVGGAMVAFELPKQQWGSGGAVVRLAAAVSVEGTLAWRPRGSTDKWTYVRMERQGGSLMGTLPAQPAGTLIEYRAVAQNWGERVWLTGPPLTLRFYGDVPAPLLALHVAGLVLALLLASRAGLEAWMAKEPRLERLVRNAGLTFGIAGALGGMAVAWLALGSPWPGWPRSGDWTGAAALLVTVLWVVALAGVRRGWTVHRVIVLAAAMATVSLYFAAHGFPA